MTNIEKIKQLAGAVDTDLQEEVESVIINAGKYVAAVTTMECAALNLQNRKGEDYRSEVSRTDTAWSFLGSFRCLLYVTPRLWRFCLCHRERNL